VEFEEEKEPPAPQPSVVKRKKNENSDLSEENARLKAQNAALQAFYMANQHKEQWDMLHHQQQESNDFVNLIIGVAMSNTYY